MFCKAVIAEHYIDRIFLYIILVFLFPPTPLPFLYYVSPILAERINTVYSNVAGKYNVLEACGFILSKHTTQV